MSELDSAYKNKIAEILAEGKLVSPRGMKTRELQASQLRLGDSSCNIITLADTDGDGIADIWETANGLNTNNVADAGLDSDGDTMSNRAEFLAGTDPANGASYLKIDSISANAGARLAFGAISNRTYSVQYSDVPGSALWFKLADIPARSTNRIETISDSDYATNRLYRLATPQVP